MSDSIFFKVAEAGTNGMCKNTGTCINAALGIGDYLFYPCYICSRRLFIYGLQQSQFLGLFNYC